MITRIAAYIGGGVLTGALALAGSGSAAAQVPALKQAQVAPTLAAAQSAPVAQDEASQNVTWFTTEDDASGWLGIRMEEVGSEKTKELKLPAERGALVTYVSEDSPAAKSGLKVNDVITDFDGQRVESTMTLQRMVREVPSGRSVTLNVWRDGHAQAITVQLASRRRGRIASRDGDFAFVAPDPPEMSFPVETPMIRAMPAIPSVQAFQLAGPGALRMFGAPMLGVDAEDLSGQLGSYFGAPDGQGVLIREVMPGTPAEKAGLKAGDVIVRVDGKRVKNSEDLRSALREKADKSSPGTDSEKAQPITSDLSVLRAGKETTVHVELQPPARKVRAVHRIAV
jgi:serine protease Do